MYFAERKIFENSLGGLVGEVKLDDETIFVLLKGFIMGFVWRVQNQTSWAGACHVSCTPQKLDPL